MTTELRFVALVGSLRADSFNRQVMESAQSLLPDSVTLEEVPLREVPMYDGDVEAAGDPDAVVALKRSVSVSDGLIIFTPEYNISVPALVKNAIDWLSRPHGSGAISAVPTGVVAASPGGRGGVGVRNHLSDTLGLICPAFHPETLGLGRVTQSLEARRLHGEAADELE
ncbi:MAG: NADPH-dependent FMN reductase, partial [Actinomycetota bacterium]